MANRAYLFSGENDSYRLNRDETPYYDSRWNIPLLWFLFFDEHSIRFRTVFVYDEPERPWQEAVLVEKTDLAIKRFEELKSEIKKLLRLSEIDIDSFVSNIGGWKGDSLILDPSEIIQDEGEKSDTKTLNEFSSALRFAANGELQKAFEVLDKYAGGFEVVSKTARNFTNYFIGYTYR